MCNQTTVGSSWKGGHVDECLRVKTGIKNPDTIESDENASESIEHCRSTRWEDVGIANWVLDDKRPGMTEVAKSRVQSVNMAATIAGLVSALPSYLRDRRKLR